MNNKKISYLTFHIGSEVFGANVKYIQNIIEYTRLTKVPEMPSYVPGVMNLRGEVLPVIDSRIKLGLPVSEKTSNTCIIVLEVILNGIETKHGLLVDEVSEVLEIEDSSIKEPPAISLNNTNNVISGVFSRDGKFIMLLNIHKVLDANEILSTAIAM